MPFGKGTAGLALEIGLKIGRLRPVLERYGDFQPPRPVLRSMRNFPGIMPAEAILQVVGEADIMALRIGLADEEIDVGEVHRSSIARF